MTPRQTVKAKLEDLQVIRQYVEQFRDAPSSHRWWPELLDPAGPVADVLAALERVRQLIVDKP